MCFIKVGDPLSPCDHEECKKTLEAFKISNCMHQFPLQALKTHPLSSIKRQRQPSPSRQPDIAQDILKRMKFDKEEGFHSAGILIFFFVFLTFFIFFFFVSQKTQKILKICWILPPGINLSNPRCPTSTISSMPTHQPPNMVSWINATTSRKLPRVLWPSILVMGMGIMSLCLICS